MQTVEQWPVLPWILSKAEKCRPICRSGCTRTCRRNMRAVSENQLRISKPSVKESENLSCGQGEAEGTFAVSVKTARCACPVFVQRLRSFMYRQERSKNMERISIVVFILS